MALERIKKKHSFLEKFKNITSLVLEGFKEQQISVGAATLTYYTLLAIIPILAFFIGYARGFLTEATFVHWLTDSFPQHKEAVEEAISIARRSLNQTHNGIIVGVGAVLYLWSGIQLITQLEAVMNEMWEVDAARPFFSRIGDYISLFFLAPLLAGISISATAYFSGGVDLTEHWMAQIPLALTLIYFLIHVVPIFLSWVLFTFVIFYMPNTKVMLKPAIIAGGFTALCFQLLQLAYLYSQSWLSSYNTIYGTLVALPLLLLWVNLSWTFILLGGKVGFAIQHANNYGFHIRDKKIAHRVYCALAIRIMELCVKSWVREEPPLEDDEIASTLEIPQGLANMLLEDLVAAGLLVEIYTFTTSDRTFQIATNSETLTVAKVLDILRSHGDILPFMEDKHTRKIKGILDKFSEITKNSDANCLIRDLS